MIVLDTHTLLWMDRNDEKLGAEARRLIERAWQEGLVAVSAITFWESAMLAERGRIVLPTAVEMWRSDLLLAGVREIAVDGRIALSATRLENLHRDPADRFIVSTAIHCRGLLITADARILEWQSELSRHDARV
jgi:PIN domain nuclease of toxin-antitoxin system